LEDLVGSVGGPDVRGIESVAKVFGQRFPELGELTVRVAVEPNCGFRYSCCDGGLHVRRNAMRILIDVQQDGNIQLRGTVGGKSAKVGPEGKSVQTL
jgi:hypothetical protein